MSDNKKYYYLKLKENHFESDEMVVLESMPDGYKYSNILLKLYLRSLKNGGKLMFNDRIPFNSTMLSTITRHSVGDIEKAVKIFEELGLVEILDNGAIYMNEIQNFIGKGSTEAERKALYRAKIDEEKKSLGQCPTDCPDICPPEKELDIELKKELELEPSLLLSPEKERKHLKSLQELKHFYINTFNNSGKTFQQELVGGYVRLTIRGGLLHNLETGKDLCPDDAKEVWGLLFDSYLQLKSAS